MSVFYHRATRIAGGRATCVAGGLVLSGAIALFAVGCGESAESAADGDVADQVSLEPTFATPEALAEAILEGFATQNGEALESYPLNQDQFRVHVWPQLPSSRPERGVPFEFGWGDLYQKSHNSLLATYARYKGVTLELLELRFEDGVTDYETYKVHRDARVKVRKPDGGEVWLDLFGSVMEMNGRYKLFSYVVD